MEECLEIILNADKPCQRGYLKKSLVSIMKYDFNVVNRSQSRCITSSPEKIAKGFILLYDKWHDDVTIVRLLLTSLTSILKSACWGHLVAAELCSSYAVRFIALLDSLLNEKTEHAMKILTCEAVLALLRHRDAASSMGRAARSKCRRHFMSMLSRNRSSKQTVMLCLSSLILLLCGSSMNEQQKFTTSESIQIFLDICIANWVEAEVVKDICKIIGLLAFADSQNPIILSKEVINVLLLAMQQNDSDLELQEINCQTIASLSEDRVVCDSINAMGGTKLIMKTLAAYPRSQKIVLAGLLYLENVARTSCNGASDASFLREIFNAMFSHQDDAHIQEAACRALSGLLNRNPKIGVEIGEDKGQLSIHNSVLAAMNIHLNDSYVFQAACGALHDMANASNRIQEYLVAKGTYVTIVDHMREKLKDPEIQEWGFRALRALSCKNVLQEELLFKYGLLTDIKQTLHEHDDVVGVLEEALSMLACLAADMEIVRRQCMIALIHERVAEIIDTHDDSIPLMKTCLETLAILAASEEQTMLIGCLDHLERVLRKYKFCADIQINGCIILQILANEELFENSVLCSNIVELVCSSLSNFPCNEDVQLEALVTLKVLAEFESGPNAIVDQNAFEQLFEVLNSANFVDLGCYAAEVLILLIANQNNKDRMLRRCIINGKLKEASWLIRNDANVNACISGKSNLRIATEMENIRLVTFLLEHGATEIEDALRTAQKLNNHKLTGILLRHIGLEKKSGMLAWGNMNISELKTEYFSSILIGEAAVDHPVSKDDRWDDYFARASDSRLRRYSSFDDEELDTQALPELPLTEIPEIKLSRPRSLTGAVLPFVSMDPRLEGPVLLYDRFVRLDSPVLRNSYPGHPGGHLIGDKACGVLLPSPDKDKITANMMTKARATSALSCLIVRCNSLSNDNESTAKQTQRKVTKKHSGLPGLGAHRNSKSDIEPFISYSDMSCNSLSDFDAILPLNFVINTFLHGLVGLDLHNNKIKKFPSELSNELKNLKQLNISANELEEFPYDILMSGTVEVLNLSKNRIQFLRRERLRASLSLRTLEMNDNLLATFPAWLGDVFPALTSLQLSGNRISQLPSKCAHLCQLKRLNLNNNDIETVPSQFLDGFMSLTKVDLSNNSLIFLPDQSAATFNRMTHLKLSHNRLAERAPLFVPRFVLQLQNLTVLDISYNQIVEIPRPSMWATKCLRDLNFDHNRIRKWDLDESAKDWSSLFRLSIAYNKLDNLPTRVGQLTKLTYLNVGHNPLKNIPDQLGKLKNLIEFPLDGLSLYLHPSVQQGTAREICSFLYSRMKNAVPYLRMKLMVVGTARRGKTALLRALQGFKPQQCNSATVGIEIGRWNLTVPRKHPVRTENKISSMIFSTWDLAGQEDFYSTHQCFLSSRALYLAVYDASKGEKDLQTLRSWLLNIKAVAPGASVILVGTHADKVQTPDRPSYFDNLQSCVESFMANPGFPTCKGSAIVCCTRKGNDIEALKLQILNTVAKFTFENQTAFESKVPKSYVDLEDLLREEANKMIQSKQIPMISRRQLIKIIQENNISLENEELDQAVKFLGEAGVLLHYDDPSLHLEDSYFIHPEWLSQMMARVVTVKEINPFVNELGMMKRANVPLLFKGELFHEAFIDKYLSILQKFEVIIPLDDINFLIPSKLPPKPLQFTSIITDRLSKPKENLVRYYKFPYIPVAFWSRLILRLLLFRSPMQNKENLISEVEYWIDGLYRFWSLDEYFMVKTSESCQDTLEIIVPVSQGGYELLGYLVDHVDTLIEEWYPGLAKANSAGQILVERLVPCYDCLSDETRHHFPLEQCIKQSYESDFILCPTHEGEVNLGSIAPDVVLADVDRKYLISDIKLNTHDMSDNTLGGGAFGSVYQIKYNGTNVAVKVFTTETSAAPHRLLRQEVNILRHLHHPSLVHMQGVCLRPYRALVMELAHIGSLRKVLNDGRHLSRGMQHRIASQVTEGLAYLHKHNIIYRDMKPGNILIFSLTMGIAINAKISDYGISQFVTPRGFSKLSGTVGYRAPEVVRREVTYNKEADIFSLGITLYELVTAGKKPFDSSQFHQEVDATVLSKTTNKPITTAGCPQWPDMENILVHCLLPQPDKRPTAEAIVEWLHSADTLCLKQEVAVCKGQSVECMTIQNVSQNDQHLELWIGSGDSTGQCQISWLSLTGQSQKKQGCRGMIIRDERVLCMLAIAGKLVLAGTMKGHIIVFDSDQHKQLHVMSELSDSVLCLTRFVDEKERLVIAGLANGHVVVYNEKQFNASDAQPILELDITSNLGQNQEISTRYPVTCLCIARKKCYVGFGSKIAIVDPKQNKLERILYDCGENNKIIANIDIRKSLWISSKDSSRVRCLDPVSGHLRGSFDCMDILSKIYPEVAPRDSRVLSLYLRENALWVGCGSGHVIIVDPQVPPSNHNFKVLAIVSRHLSEVRCITGAYGIENGKEISLVLTGGIGFKERSQCCELEESKSGYILFWEAELPSQHAYLKSVQKTREEMINAM